MDAKELLMRALNVLFFYQSFGNSKLERRGPHGLFSHVSIGATSP